MDAYDLILLLLLSLLRADRSLSATTFDTLPQGSSLSVGKPEDVLVSPNGVFSAGFSSVGDNAFCFTITFNMSSPPTIVWMANRDQPVNGFGSKLTLSTNGNLILLDAGRTTLWSTETTSSDVPVHLRLHDNGNLVLYNTKGESLWESFNSPTDTLLAEQRVTKEASLLSSKSRTNCSSGYYKLFFDNDNVLRLLFQGPDPQISSLYWPDPWLRPFETGRSTYNNSKLGVFNSTGHFWSSDNMVFSASDCDAVLHRKLTIDPDGNLRMYSFNEKNKTWVVTWQAVSEPCKIHGVCGPNSFCTHDHALGRRCSCLQGFKMKSYLDWSYGCESEFSNSMSDTQELGFIRLANAEFYGYDKQYYSNLTLQECQEECLKFHECKALQYSFSDDSQYYNCYLKPVLLNGRHTPNFQGDVYLKMPKAVISSMEVKPPTELKAENCPHDVVEPLMLNRTYERARENGSIEFLLWFAVSVAGVEITCMFLVLFCLFWNKSEGTDKATGGYMRAATRFQKFSYAELKRATRGFHEEIGRGAGGVVYKGVLADRRVAAIKRLNEANGAEAEFLTEVNTIGGLNHMNLIEIWGYCAEGKHRLLVYEYMENGSLASKLVSSSSNTNNNELDWEKRFEIALGTAKGLAYLHEECLEWVLHCDVKPQNILLDSSYRPKVADFGLSKLQYRSPDMSRNSSFSKIRGTRGYMAPEWVYNLPITSKADVYSYGIVALEIVTGRRPTEIQTIYETAGGGGMALVAEQHGRLVTWVKEKMVNRGIGWIEQVADPVMGGKFNKEKLEAVVKVAMQCVEEDREARPTMGQVVEMLQYCNDDEL